MKELSLSLIVIGFVILVLALVKLALMTILATPFAAILSMAVVLFFLSGLTWVLT